MRFSRLCACLFVAGLFLLATACAPVAASTGASATPCPQSTTETKICSNGLPSETATLVSQEQFSTPVAPNPPLPPASMTPQTPASVSPSPTATRRQTSTPTTTPTPLPTPTPCPPGWCTYAAQFFLARPIAPPGNDNVDATYRFGSTQGGMRDPHHGVELLNGYGTPVLAAADGKVVVAGDDTKIFYGPYSNFYGNLVVLSHPVPPALLLSFPDMPQPVYTLYGHLSSISVKTGQQVKAGQEIGKVGMSGVATGSHLHFEVRLGENTYKNSRNPELWLDPHTNKNGQPKGALAGRILDKQGNSLEVSGIVLQHLPDGPQKPKDFEVYLMTYEEKALRGLPPWEESFAIGDLKPGLYRLSFPHFGLQEYLIQVYPGQLTMVTLRPEG